MCRHIRPVLFAAAALVVFGCNSKKDEPEPTPAEAPAKPQPFTVGNVTVKDLPGAKRDAIEVLVLPEIPESLRTSIKNQQDALTAFLQPPQAEPEPAEQPEMSSQDATNLNWEIKELRDAFPPPRVSTFEVEQQERDFTSDIDLHEKYERFINALNASNFERGLQHILKTIKEDHAALQQRVEEKFSEKNALQAQADINWLSDFSKYLQGFQKIVDSYNEKRLTFAKANQPSPNEPPPEQVWREYQIEHAQQLEIDVYKHALDGEYLDENGEFVVEAVGKIVVRVELDGDSVFLLPAGPGGQYLWMDFSVIEPESPGNPT